MKKIFVFLTVMMFVFTTFAGVIRICDTVSADLPPNFCGQVSDKKGNPLSNVIVEGYPKSIFDYMTLNGRTITNDTGRYRLFYNMPNEGLVCNLKFSKVGYNTEIFDVEIIGKDTHQPGYQGYTVDVKLSKIKVKHKQVNPFLSNLFDMFPNAFQLLRFILKL